ncbi:MAG: MotA/TolQ/ExbB proton channel family protein [Verrucomicrobia bacterium]|nr:MAG: MotA/TolQ/ExbB proton channel family protein [Verrucomicrobiota bacterium]
MFVWLREGGGFTWLLLGLSVVAVAFILERGWALRRSRVAPPNLERLLGVADPDALRGACAAQPSPLGNLVLSILDHLQWTKAENVAALEVAARREMMGLERGLVVLEILVGIAPLLGLVGTIYGIIPLFGDFGKAVSGDNSLLAKGIGASLNKTLLGLMVAIPSLVAWSYFNKQVEVLAVEMESLCDRLLRRHYLGEGTGARAQAPKP